MNADLGAIRARLAAHRPRSGPLPRFGDDIDSIDWEKAPLTAAAVLVAIVTRPEPTVVFTKRHSGLRRHAGQVAFPGGRIDPGEDAVGAALREAEEEIGLSRSAVEVVAALDDYVTGTSFRVTPVVGFVPPGLPLAPAEAEVEAVFEVPLAHLLDTANHLNRSGEWKGRRRSFYLIPWQPDDIWGATADMVVNLADILGGTP